MKRTYLILLLLLFFFSGAKKCLSQTIDIEVDPIAYIFNGFSVH